MSKPQSLLITVGTTGFDDLIHVVCSESFVRELVSIPYSSIIIQYGSSKQCYNPFYFKKYGIHVQAFDYCPSLAPYFEQVNCVIGHAGAGTILDTLHRKLPLLVVVNEKLMGNHQHEIADAMAEGHYLLKSTPSTLIESFRDLQQESLNVYPEAHPEYFVSYLNQQMRFV